MAAKLSGEELSHSQRVDLISFQVKMIRLAKKEEEAQKLLATQRDLVGKMAPYLTEAIHMAHDGQFEDTIPRFRGALERQELADDTPLLSPLFPSARQIVHAHLLYCLDEDNCMRGTNRPTGWFGVDDKGHVMRCPRCSQQVKANRRGEPTGAMWFHLKCVNCSHDWKRVFAVVPDPMAPPD